MKEQYKLIKVYPGSPELGFILEQKSGSVDANKYPEFWEKVVEKDYEILTILNNNNDIFPYLTNKSCIEYLAKSGFKIHSVKRLSDGEIFTIGDKVEFNIHAYKHAIGIISGFVIYNNTSISFVDNQLGYNSILKIIGNKIKQPLFTTEDGVDIFDLHKDEYYFIRKDYLRLNLKKSTDYNDGFVYEPEIEVYFKSKEKAEEYILMNKPMLSLIEVANNSNITVGGMKSLIKLVKSKL